MTAGIASLKDDQAKYRSDSASTGYYATDVPTRSAISAAITAGHKAVAREHATTVSARSQAAELISQAKAYVTRANKLCDRAGG